MSLKINNLRQELASRQRQTHALSPTSQIPHLKKRFSDYEKALQGAFRPNCNLSDDSLTRTSSAPQLDQRWQRFIQLKQERFKNVREALQSIDPKKLLKRGYAILLAEKKPAAVTSVNDVVQRDRVRLCLQMGNFYPL